MVHLARMTKMAKNTSVLWGDRFERFIQEEISTGRYQSASEEIRSALRLLELEGQKIKLLKEAIEKGEQGEMIYNFDPEAHLESLHKKFQSK